MGSLSEILGAIASVAVIVGIVIALLELRWLRAARIEQTVLSAYQRMGEPDFIASIRRAQDWDFAGYDDFRQRATDADWTALWSVGIYFEGLGLMVHHGAAPVTLVEDLVRGDVTYLWTRFKPIMTGYREALGQPGALEWFEYLNNEIVRRRT